MRLAPAFLTLLIFASSSGAFAVADNHSPVYKFDFGPGVAADGWIKVEANQRATTATPWGFHPGAAIKGIDRTNALDRGPVLGDFVTSDGPFYFSVALPEGNYRVRVTAGGVLEESSMTVKAELRRLMLEGLVTKQGEQSDGYFTVAIRTPKFPGGEVRLKSRERESEWAAWDDKLTLEFNGTRPALCAMTIAPCPELPTVFLIGDSTMTDQPLEPWNSWGQMLTRFLKPTVVVANHGESGETVRDSLGRGRFDKIWSLFKPGDYLFIQFGHNDMKSRAENAIETYKREMKQVVLEARRRGGTPVLVTSMERKNGLDAPTLGVYPEKVRELAAEENVPLIDLNKTSLALYRALGDNLDAAFQDGTHHTNYGSYLFAKCVAQGIKENVPGLASELAVDFTGFDPARPDPLETFEMPASSEKNYLPPLGN
jgi:lysophospholipase L1-like esterase